MIDVSPRPYAAKCYACDSPDVVYSGAVPLCARCRAGDDEVTPGPTTVQVFDSLCVTAAQEPDPESIKPIDPSRPEKPASVTININSPTGENAEMAHAISRSLAEYFVSRRPPGGEQ